MPFRSSLRRTLVYTAILFGPTGLVALAAFVQFRYMLDLPPSPQLFAIPLLLAVCFGFLLVYMYELHRRLQGLARTDPLTGVYNRRELMHYLEVHAGLASRYGRPFTVAMYDLDHFKQINDRFGHNEGDRALRHVSQILLGRLRSADMVGRWGGEEFLAVLPETTLADALAPTESVRQEIENRPPRPTQITISAGLAQYSPGESLEQLIARADAALYRAKAAGRNRVMQSEPTT